MSTEPLHLVSDFNIDLLASSLRSVLSPGRSITTAPFGQVHQTFLAPHQHGITAQTTAIVWTRPEGMIEGFRRALQFEPVNHDSVLEEVERYTDALQTLARSCRYVLHPTWTLPATRRLYGMLDLKPGLGVRHLLSAMNLALARAMSSCANLYVLDAEPWLRAVGAKAYGPKMELITKVPFAPGVFTTAAKDIKAALAGLAGEARKIVVVDLDNTLWGGVVGDDGVSGIRLGGHDPIGEAFVAFQRSLLALTRRGIQLAIASKNDEALAFEVIDHHPEMVLRRQHFAGWRINWNDKAANIAELSEELRLGRQSFVFIDDNPVERSRVATEWPELLVPEWPVDPALYAPTLDAMDCFDIPQITTEDFERTATQAAEQRRRASLATASYDEWLASLGTVVSVEPLSATNLSRVTQLFNKTNQLNLTTRRLSAAEIDAWASGAGRRLWAIRVRDRFGDSGLTGVIGVELNGTSARVTDMILSCRVMGRQVERAMLHLASSFAHRDNAGALHVEYQRTERNGPSLKMLTESGLSQQSDTLFVWDQPQPYPLPAAITLEA